MTAILGVVTFDGSAVDAPTLRDLARGLQRWGPDDLHVRIENTAGFAKAALATREGGARGHLGSDHLWIAADARIDAREDLLAALDPEERGRLADAPDEDWILAAYRRWGERCTEYLRGDFAFAIWDARRRRLFCARDPFGVKPFFYASDGRRFVFSNVLHCMRGFPGVSTRLDDLAIADFLMFEHSQRPDSTAFADIRRLPPAHALSRHEAAIAISRYWSLPEKVSIRYRRSGEYVEHLHEVLARAVADRITLPRVAVMMSGGLDSTSVAAVALAARPGVSLRAYASVHDTLIPDEERHYSGLAAAALGIPIEYGEADRYSLYEGFDKLGDYFPEPGNEPHAVQAVDLAQRAATHARIALTGWDGDALLTESPRPYFAALARDGHWTRAAVVASTYAWQRPGSLWRQWKRIVRPGPTAAAPAFPSWIHAQFAAGLKLQERWDAFHSAPRLTQPLRPYAYHVLEYIARRSDFFDAFHPAWTGVPMEFRHPLLDLRVIEFCLSVPPYPWCHHKELLRRAMSGRLPQAIARRPKTPLAGFPYMALLARDESHWVDDFIACAATERYVEQSRLPPARSEKDPDKAWALLRPLGLDLWLRRQRAPQHHRKEIEHEFA